MNLPSTCRQITKGVSLQYFWPLAAFVSLVFCVSAVARSKMDEAAIKELEKKGFTVTRKGNAMNIEAEGNLGPNKPFVGTSLDEIDPENNPVDLALRSVALFLEDRKAAHRLALAARLRGRFDIARVSDPSAHEAFTVLLSKRGIDDMLMWAGFDPDLERRNIRAVTEWALKTGRPLYASRWMVQHGVRVLDAAIKGEEIGSGLVSEFDAPAAWKKRDRAAACAL